MSSMSSGFWISPDGDIEFVTEHLIAVECTPRKYGLKDKDVIRLGITGHKALSEWREKTLVMVMKNGWIRVRGHREYTTFEGWCFDEWFLGRVRLFLKERHYWPTDNIAISDLSRQKFIEVSVQDITSNRADTWAMNPKPRRRRKDPYPDLGHR